MFRIARYGSLSAAALALAALAGWFTFMNGTAKVAFADVVKKMKEAKSVQLVVKQKFGKQPEFAFDWYIEGQHIRMESPGQVVVVVDLKKKQSVQLERMRKKAYRKSISKDATKPYNNFLYQLRNLRPEGAKRRADEKIDGRTALVYEFDDLSKINFMGLESAEGQMKIWVDPKSKLPVKIVVKANTNADRKSTDRPFDTTLTFEKFEWNKKFDPSLFSLEIPKGYTVVDGPRTPNN